MNEENRNANRLEEIMETAENYLQALSIICEYVEARWKI